MVNLILTKYVITNPIAKSDIYKVMYVTLPITSDWIGDIQTVFSDLILMLQKLSSWESTAPNTVKLVTY